MKITLLAFFTLFSIINHSQTDPIDVPELWETDTWDGVDWNTVSQVTYTFNSNCLPTEALGKTQDFGGSNMLENTTFLTIQYNGNDLPIESINQLWDEDTGTWKNQLKTTFTYSGTNLTESVTYNWLDNTWEPSIKDLNQYNASNLIIENIEQTRDEVNNVWLNSSKTEYTYNSNGKFNFVTTYTWNASNGTWVKDIQETYTYSDDFATSLKTDKWNGTFWENNRLRVYAYDGNDFLIETLKTKWNGNTYDNEDRILMTNNNEGLPTEMINQTWFFGAWLSVSRDRRTYPDCKTLSKEKIVTSGFKLYPNPTKNNIHITSKTAGAYSIINAQGQTLRKGLLVKDGNSIDLSTVSNGLYFIHINTNHSFTKKIIKN